MWTEGRELRTGDWRLRTEDWGLRTEDWGLRTDDSLRSTESTLVLKNSVGPRKPPASLQHFVPACSWRELQTILEARNQRPWIKSWLNCFQGIIPIRIPGLDIGGTIFVERYKWEAHPITWHYNNAFGYYNAMVIIMPSYCVCVPFITFDINCPRERKSSQFPVHGS